jgi:hypothetical protein
LAVALLYLGGSPFDQYELAVWAGGHVAVGQHAGERVRRGLELDAEDVGESAFAGFDDGAGVVCDQAAQHGIGVLGVAQVPGAVQGVQPAAPGASDVGATRRLPADGHRERDTKYRSHLRRPSARRDLLAETAGNTARRTLTLRACVDAAW